jgi:hypothetical protein
VEDCFDLRTHFRKYEGRDRELSNIFSFNARQIVALRILLRAHPPSPDALSRIARTFSLRWHDYHHQINPF